MATMDMSSMSDDDRERLEELRSREASGMMDDTDRKELKRLEDKYSMSE